MSTFAKVKCFISSFLVIYAIYLYSYKCSTIEANSLNPLFNAHSELCHVLTKGESYVQPYVAKVTQFLDTNVHSRPTFKQYKVEEKLSLAKSSYNKYVNPYVVEVYKLIEILELKVYQYYVLVLEQLKLVYTEKVAPLVGKA